VKKLIVPLVLALAVLGCGKDESAGPGATSSPTSSATATPAPSGTGTTQVRIYYLISSKDKLYLAPEKHQIPRTPTIARSALEELVHGKAQDPDHTTPFPAASKINSVTAASGVATVDWSADVLTASVGSRAEALGIQSVVYTLTEFSTIKKVRFTVEGKDRGAASNGRTIEDWWGHAGLAGQPWDRDPPIDVLEPITLFSPVDGASSAGLIKLIGEASTFEANVGIVLRDATGKAVVETSTTASIGAPARGSFTKSIRFTAPSSVQTWTLEVSEESAEDGSVVFLEDRSIVVG
jgi:germination protein M